MIGGAMRLNPAVVRTAESPISAVYEGLPTGASWLDLAQASPPYPPAPQVVDHVSRFARDPAAASYTDVPGMLSVRTAVADDLNETYRATLGPGNITVTAGANQAFCLVADCLAASGDEVILASPYYFNHHMWLNARGVHVRYLDAGEDMIPRADTAATLLSARTKMIVLVSPGNPTGMQIPTDELDRFAELAAASGSMLVLDETYRSFTQTADEGPHQLFSRPGWGDHVATLYSFSKELALPGYRVGAIAAGPKVAQQVHKLADCVAVCAPRLSQEAVLVGLQARRWRAERALDIAAQQAAFAAAMQVRPGGFKVLAQGGFFAWMQHPQRNLSSTAVASRLADHGVLTLAGNAFTPTDPGALRVSVSNLPSEDIPQFVAALGAC